MTARYEDRRLVVAIADTGKGMEPADRERIFQELPAYRVLRVKRGLDLDFPLSVCWYSCLKARLM